ncbi:uncharacterized protein LOC100209757 [Hydra vulgaris]|uniref:Ubiquinone biosynthesis protein COQ4 homolog, mitochondrial n=1 Tax=Hydra vulgaris TaxID=6087 RepID=A0ABM4D3Q8_HYDVU
MRFSMNKYLNCLTQHKMPKLSLKVRNISQHQSFVPKSSDEFYDLHIQTSPLQKIMLTVGSAFAALYNPYRGDMVAALGETTGHFALQKLHLQMLNDDTGYRILKEKPIIDSHILDVKKLLCYPKNTLGYCYGNFMHSQNLSADDRSPVRFVDNTELAYVMKRYRQIHDFCHVILGFSVDVSAEIVVKWFECFHFNLPMAALSSVFGPLALNQVEQKELINYIPWAIFTGMSAKPLLNVYFEKNLERDIFELRNELHVYEPPKNGLLHKYW